MKLAPKILCFVAMLGSTTGFALADSKLVMKETTSVNAGASGSAPKETTIEYTIWMGNDRAARVEGQTRLIVRIDLGETYIVNDADKSATVIPFDGLPEAASAAPAIFKTGETKMIGEWKADRYELSMDLDGLKGTIILWVSDDVAVEKNAYRAFYKSLDGGTGMMTAIAELPGYPVLQEADLGFVKSIGKLLSASDEDPPDGVYDIPSDYRRN